MKVLKAGALYFALVFGAGFMLAPLRIFWAVPRYGTRIADLMEMPIMFVVVILAARFVVRHLAVEYSRLSRLGMGLLALGSLLAAEFAVVLKLRHMSFSEYAASIDPVSGTVYYAMLGLYAIMPLLVERRGNP